MEGVSKMNFLDECKEYMTTLLSYMKIEGCDIFLDTETKELVLVPIDFFMGLNEAKIASLLQRFPKWWIEEALIAAQIINTDTNNRFIKVLSTKIETAIYNESA
jgi:hypothetical protein